MGCVSIGWGAMAVWGALALGAAVAQAEPTVTVDAEDVALAPIPQILVSPFLMRAASAGSGWLVVYPPPAGALTGQLFDAQGHPSGEPFDISPNADARQRRLDWLEVVFDGVNFVVAWIEGGQPHALAQTVSPQG